MSLNWIYLLNYIYIYITRVFLFILNGHFKLLIIQRCIVLHLSFHYQSSTYNSEHKVRFSFQQEPYLLLIFILYLNVSFMQHSEVSVDQMRFELSSINTAVAEKAQTKKTKQFGTNWILSRLTISQSRAESHTGKQCSSIHLIYKTYQSLHK